MLTRDTQTLLILSLLLTFPPLLFSQTPSPSNPVSIKIDVVRDNLLQYSGFNIGDVLFSNSALMSSLSFGVGDRIRATALALDLRYIPSRHFVSNLVPMFEIDHKGFGLSFLYLPTWLFTNPTIAEQYFIGLSYSIPADQGVRE